MIPGGRIQDKYGAQGGRHYRRPLPGRWLHCRRIDEILWWLWLSVSASLGGIGMGIGYAAPTPAALKWFGPHQRGLVAGLVVSGYGAAAMYIAPLASYLIDSGGVTF